MIIMVAFIACSGTKSAIKEISGEGTVTQARTNDITYIKMHRSACFGKCPDYIIELYKNGLVRYTGRGFVDMMGIYEKQYPQPTVQTVFDAFDEKRVDTTQDVYDLTIADLPGIYYTIEYGSRTKKINNAHFGPVFLRDLANLVDSTIKVDRSWTKISDNPKGD